MIIKSHIRGGIRSVAQYMKEVGKNEKTRLVDIQDPSAKTLDEAFQNMWAVASNTRATKPLHHISINPMKSETLTDKQVLAIVERCEKLYGYKHGEHQRVIVEHVLDGRQHFHVIWNRVNRMTNKVVWPGEHWKKSKQVCREMEAELGLMRPISRGKHKPVYVKGHRQAKPQVSYASLKSTKPTRTGLPAIVRTAPIIPAFSRPAVKPVSNWQHYLTPLWFRPRQRKERQKPDIQKARPHRPNMELAELIAWAFENGRLDILAQYGILLPPDYFEP